MIKIKFGLILIVLAFGSENEENKVKSADSEERFMKNNREDLVLVKIEEDEYTKVQKKVSKYIGVYYNGKTGNWRAVRHSKKEKKMVYNGNYKYEETAAHASDTLARKLMENDEQKLKLNFPDDDTDMHPETKMSKYFGVYYDEKTTGWRASRWSKSENKNAYNGYYDDEETAAHASDTLARKLIANGEQNHKLNFPDDNTEMYPEKKTTSSKYIGVTYIESKSKWLANRTWCAARRSKNEKKMIYNGSYKDEETAAHASDTLARKLMANGKYNHKLNFPDDHTEVKTKEIFSSIYIGVTCNKHNKRWLASRWIKNENKRVYNGTYRDEETAAHASDTLARKLMENGEQNHKLNYPDDDTEVYPEEKRTTSIYIGVSYHKTKKIWAVNRRSKNENKMITNGTYRDEETAAHASDTLARNLMATGVHSHKLNFPDDHTEVYPETNQRNKRKRSVNEDLEQYESK